MNGDNLHPLDATHCAREERTATSGASRSAQDTNTINNAPQIRRPAADATGTSQGRGRAHTLPHDYCAQSNSSPGCERRRRRKRLAHQHQHAHAYAAAAAGRPSAATPIVDITSTDSGLGPSETFPPSPCRPSLHTRRRLQSLDGGLAMEGVDTDLTCSEPPSAFNGGHVQPSQSEAAGRHQITGCGRSSIGRDRRWRNSSPPFQKLASITAAVVMVCVMVVLTTDSYHRNQKSYHRKAAVSSSHTATKEWDPINSGRYDPEVRFLPGMRMEIISEANEVQDVLKGGGEDRDPTLASPKTQRGEQPDLSPRGTQRTGNGRKKRRPRLAHARASFDPIIPSQDAADNGTSRESGLRGQGKVQEKTPKRKFPTFVLPPEETQQDNVRDSLQNIEAVERAYSMSWSKVFVLVAMTVLCVQLLASLRRA